MITRAAFVDLLEKIKQSKKIVVDTEAEGLSIYRGDKLIGVSLYLPDFDVNVYLPFHHGEGRLTTEGDFASLKWDTRKKQLYIKHWFNKLNADFQNLPSTWEDELKEVLMTPDQTVIFHNAIFDLAVLRQAGYNMPVKIVDTLIGLHLVNEDMGNILVKAPYTVKGVWQRDAKGNLLLKTQYANKQLKWFCAYLGIEGATRGEENLDEAIHHLEERLIDIAYDNLSDPYNDSLRYKRPNPRQKERIAKKLKLGSKGQMWMLPGNEVAPYAALDTVLTWKLYEWICDILVDWDNLKLWQEQNETLLWVTFPANYRGMLMDVAEAQRQLEDAQAKASTIAHSFPVSITSNPKLLAFLNTEVANGKLTSVDKKALYAYQDHPLVEAVIKYRKLTKMSGTYLSRWLNNRDANNVIHPMFSLTGTSTGRLSSSGDAGNQQNIPDRGGYTLKRSFIPRPGYVFLTADYGQLELRLGAWVAKEHTMIDLFNNGADMHAYTRDQINVRNILFGAASSEAVCIRLGYSEDSKEYQDATKTVDSYCRFVAKTMNFGLLYNGSEKMLAILLKITREEALPLVTAWRQLYPAFPKANKNWQKLGLTWRPKPASNDRSLYITQPISGRHRRYDKYRDNVTVYYEDGTKHEFSEKIHEAGKGFNAIVQGLGGYIANTSALKIARTIPQDELFIFGIIHDALEMEVREDCLHHVATIQHIMTDWDINPQLTVDFGIGRKNWHDIDKYIPNMVQ